MLKTQEIMALAAMKSDRTCENNKIYEIEKALIDACSPTLAGVKVGNLFACDFSSAREAAFHVDRIRCTLCRKNIGIRIVRWNGKRALIYVYRVDKLDEIMADTKVREFMQEKGYDFSGDCVSCLANRLAKGGREEICDFPHEIGVFLGYPLEDVLGYIENKGRNSKLTGYWKVYGDANEARRVFSCFKKCTEIYQRMYAAGKGIGHLAVGSRV